MSRLYRLPSPPRVYVPSGRPISGSPDSRVQPGTSSSPPTRNVPSAADRDKRLGNTPTRPIPVSGNTSGPSQSTCFSGQVLVCTPVYDGFGRYLGWSSCRCIGGS